MLWIKGWHETRFRLVFTLCILILYLVTTHSESLTAAAERGIVVGSMVLVAVISGMLAGAGIATQPSFQASRGIHGSQLYTLSMPVSRKRLLAVRATLGWIESAGVAVLLCATLWVLPPGFRGVASVQDFAEHAFVLIAGSSAIYSVSVLLATMLEDLYRVWGTMIFFFGLWWVRNHLALPASIDFLGAMGPQSPLLTHSVEWSAVAFSFVFAAALIYAAVRVVQVREY